MAFDIVKQYPTTAETWITIITVLNVRNVGIAAVAVHHTHHTHNASMQGESLTPSKEGQHPSYTQMGWLHALGAAGRAGQAECYG
jgi:hypothetical protein